MSGGTILIYGGTGGIGLALARMLRARGHGLHLVARDGERLAAAAREVDAGHTVGDVAAGEGPFAGASEAAGSPLAGLVYAVGTIDLKPLARVAPADAERDFRVNALGAMRAVQAAAPALRAHAAGGAPAAIVLFSTVAVAQGFAAHASIAMAKGAVEGLTVALAAELSPHVRVNAVAPSLTRTPLARALTANEAVANGIAAMHAIPRLGTPEDAAALAAFLVSAEAGWITGQVIGVDGGRSTVRTKG